MGKVRFDVEEFWVEVAERVEDGAEIRVVVWGAGWGRGWGGGWGWEMMCALWNGAWEMGLCAGATEGGGLWMGLCGKRGEGEGEGRHFLVVGDWSLEKVRWRWCADLVVEVDSFKYV